METMRFRRKIDHLPNLPEVSKNLREVFSLKAVSLILTIGFQENS
jgi:hypothetical protein